jgi:hypothetical protein
VKPALPSTAGEEADRERTCIAERVRLLHSATIAVAGQVPVSRLWHAVPCFPSLSEVWLRLLEAYRN